MKKSILIILLFAMATVAKSQDVPTVLKQYFAVKSALTKDNFGQATADAKAFANAVKSTTFPKGVLVTDLAKSATSLAEAKDIASQRLAFGKISPIMLKLAERTKLTAPIYVQNCPMAKQSWLSEVKNIQNPFYGNSMLTCGEVTKTITPN